MDKQKVTELPSFTPIDIARGWFFTCIISASFAWVLAILVMFFISNFFRVLFGYNYQNSSPAQIVAVLVVFATLYGVGTIVGSLLWSRSVRQLGSERLWIRSTILMVFLAFAAFFIREHYVMPQYPYSCVDCMVSLKDPGDEIHWSQNFLFISLSMVIAMGLPYWWVLYQNRSRRAHWWFAANCIYFVVNAGVFGTQENSVTLWSWMIFNPIHLVLTSLTIYYIARGEKQKRKLSPVEST